MLVLLVLAFGIGVALCLGQKPRVMLGMLLEVLARHAVIREERVTRQLRVFVDDLLRGAAHFALGTGTVEDPVDVIGGRAVTVILPART